MMKKTNCSRIVTLYHAHQSLIDEIQQETVGLDLTIDELPTLAYAFPKLGCEVASDPFVLYPPPAFRPDLDKPAIYIHSSGSTGFPKPIAHSHKVQVHWMTQRRFNLHILDCILTDGIWCSWYLWLPPYGSTAPTGSHGTTRFPRLRSCCPALCPDLMSHHRCGLSTAVSNQSTSPTRHSNERQYAGEHTTHQVQNNDDGPLVPGTMGDFTGRNRRAEENGPHRKC